MTQHSYYLGKVFDGPTTLKKTISDLSRMIKRAVKTRKIKPFTHIAVRGVSGVVVGAPLSLKLNATLIVVRKQEEKSHAIYNAEGLPGRYSGKQNLSFLIVDDLIATGNTVRKIIESIAEDGEHIPVIECVGSAVYNEMKISKDPYHH